MVFYYELLLLEESAQGIFGAEADWAPTFVLPFEAPRSPSSWALQQALLAPGTDQ